MADFILVFLLFVALLFGAGVAIAAVFGALILLVSTVGTVFDFVGDRKWTYLIPWKNPPRRSSNP